MAGSTFDPRPVSLDQFSRSVDEHYGAPLGFATAVHRLWLVRAQLKVITERRKDIHALVKDRYAEGQTVAGGDDGATYYVRTTRPTPVVQKTTVPSAVIKRHNKKLWEAARVRAPYVTTRAPINIDDTVLPNPKALPALPSMHATLAELVRAYQAVPKTEGLAAEETEAIDHLAKIAANTSWEGDPIGFTDGWGVGLTQLRYDADKLRAIAPDVYDQLAVTTESGGSTRVYISTSDDPEDTEADGE